MRSPSVTSAGGQDVPCDVNRPSEPSGCNRGSWIAPWLDRIDRHFDDQGFDDFRPQNASQRFVQAQLLDLVRAGRGQPFRLGRLYRAAQDHVGDRLSALRRLLPGGAADDRRTNRAPVSRGEASGIGRGSHGMLRPALTTGQPRSLGARWPPGNGCVSGMCI